MSYPRSLLTSPLKATFLSMAVALLAALMYFNSQGDKLITQNLPQNNIADLEEYIEIEDGL